MTLRLILIRHAKSSWDTPGQEDHARPLNARGRRAATDIGAWLESRGYRPAEALCSTAARTVETWEGIAAAMGGTLPRPTLLRALYEAGPEAMLTVLRGATASPVVVVGHNPGIGALAAALLRTPAANERYDHFPTGATAVIEFAEDDWPSVGLSRGALADFVTPRELA